MKYKIILNQRLKIKTKRTDKLRTRSSYNTRKARWLEFLCEFDFEIKHIKGKENTVVDALNMKVHEMHVASLITCQPNLRQQIINHIVNDEVYVQIKDNL